MLIIMMIKIIDNRVGGGSIFMAGTLIQNCTVLNLLVSKSNNVLSNGVAECKKKVGKPLVCAQA